MAPTGERESWLLWPAPRMFAFLKEKKDTYLTNSFISFRRRCSSCYQTRVYISCWYKMGGEKKKKSTYPKNSLPLKRKKEKSFSFWFLKRAIHFQTGLSTQASKHPGYSKPLCQFSSAWFGWQSASPFFPDSTENLMSTFSEYICTFSLDVEYKWHEYWAKQWEYMLM